MVSGICSLSDNTDRTVVVAGVVIRIQICEGYNPATMGGVDKLAVADVDTHMGDTGGRSALEEDQVTGTQVGLADGSAALIHGSTGTGNLDAVRSQHIVNKTGTVKTTGGSAAVNIGNAQIFLGSFHDLAAGGRTGGRGGI